VSHDQIVTVLDYAEMAGCIIALAMMWIRSQTRTFGFVGAFLIVRLAIDIFLLLIFRPHFLGLSVKKLYFIYFFGFWSGFAIESMLGFGIIYSVYRLAMAPLKGLQGLGILMFRWAFGIAVAISLSTALGAKVTGKMAIPRAAAELMRAESTLTLCMLLFVCLAIRPMGLSVRSKIFGVNLGLGVLATIDLVFSAWVPGMASPMQYVKGIAVCCAFLTWAAYFAMPEPKRRMIVLPTTSPFLRWNQISMALGDAPGFVALGEIHPDMFAPAELEIMRRASAKMDSQLPAPQVVNS
jgi:hypothetical protein